MGPDADERERAALRAEWRRLGRAAAFFLVCLTVLLVAAAIGIYH